MTYLPAYVNTAPVNKVCHGQTGQGKSDNDKSDILRQHLEEYRIALEVIEIYPSVLAAFKERLSRRCKQKQTQLVAI